MKNNDKNIDIIDPKNQLRLFGYENYFYSFIKLYKKNKLPNVILLNGPKGIGKATFAYHFINYLLSLDEENKYLINDFKINHNNTTYKLMSNETHPNFFLLQNNLFEDNVKIDQVRNLLKFLNKSTFGKNIKIVMIDNAEYLNRNSSNALLKALEEPKHNTFFFIIHNNSSKILSTVRSRCIEFKFFFNISQKKKIFQNIIQQYKIDFNLENIHDNFYFDSPGNLLKYLIFFSDSNIDIYGDKLPCILYLFERYKSKKDFELLFFVSLLIEQYYNELSFNNGKNSNYYFIKKNRILNEINNMKKFNLDKKNLLISLQGMLSSESK